MIQAFLMSSSTVISGANKMGKTPKLYPFLLQSPPTDWIGPICKSYARHPYFRRQLVDLVNVFYSTVTAG